MSNAACNATMTMCDKGAAPACYMTLPINRVLGQKGPYSNTNDIIPMVNTPPHITCFMGMPKPCIPSVVSPFSPTPTVYIGSSQAFKWNVSATCAQTGKITAIVPHQPTVMLG